MNNATQKNSFIIFLAIMVFVISSCAKKVNFQTSAVVPAARGYVKVKKDNNSNYAIKIQLYNLADVKRLESSRKTYVVWMETDEQSSKNIGQINSSSGMLSKTLKASFQSVSPVKPNRIFITSEDDGSTQYPGNEIILSTNKF